MWGVCVGQCGAWCELGEDLLQGLTVWMFEISTVCVILPMINLVEWLKRVPKWENCTMGGVILTILCIFLEKILFLLYKIY